MQIYHILPTVPLTTKETILQRATRSIATWRRTAIVHLPTKVLPPDLLVSTDDETKQAYMTAFTILATELILSHR